MNKIKKEKITGIGIAILIFLFNLTIILSQEKGYGAENDTKGSMAPSMSSDPDIQEIWNRTWGSEESYDSARSIWSDGTYLYTCGYTYGSLGFDPNLLIIKWDTDGNIIWNQTWGGGSVEFGVSIWGDDTFLYTCGYTDSFGAGYNDFAIVKWDADGNIIWNQTWGGEDYDYGLSIWGDGTYLYTCGYTYSFGAGDEDFALVKWDTDGNIIWNQTWGDEDFDGGFSIWGDGTYLYTCGYTDSLGAGYNMDLALVKWDANGSVIWSQTWDGGGAYGEEGKFIWGDGTYLYTLGDIGYSIGDYDLALVKWDIEGNILWNQTWGGGDEDIGYSIWGDGTYLYTLGYTGLNDFEGYNPDLLLTKWDTNGSFLWNLTWGTEEEWDSGHSIWGDGTYIYTCGATSSRDLLLIKWGLDTITDTIDPVLNTPSDITYEQATTGHNITWIATDANPNNYIIYKDGIVNASGTWVSGVPIIINVDGLNIDSYNYTIVVFDVSSNSATDTVNVIVVEASPEDDSDDDQAISGYSLNTLAFVVISVISVIMIAIVKQKLHYRT